MLKIDHYNRIGFIVVGAFSSYALGANNISSVMGVFIASSPLKTLQMGGLSLSPTEQLFLIGGLAVATGVISYSGKVMKTIGKGITELTPLGGFVVVAASSLVLFVFASKRLEFLLNSAGLPSIPLVPVSSSQAVVGAIMGLAFLKGGRGLNYGMLGKIGLGWLATPVFAGLMAFVSLFVMQNVFGQNVYRPVKYMLTPEVSSKLESEGLYGAGELSGIIFDNAVLFKRALDEAGVSSDGQRLALGLAELNETE
jgi:PiT family inorganic phosphate transporter